MRELIESIRARDPAAPTLCEVIFAYPGFHAVAIFHPVSQFLWRYDLRALARIWAHLGRWFTGIEIHPQARLGKNLFIDHGFGVVIGQTAEVGDNCTIYQNVTLGGKGNGLAGEKRHPTLGDDVMIGAGAHILGPIVIGDHARIGAGAVVTADVAEGAVMAGNPARLIRNVLPEDHCAYGLLDGECADPVVKQLQEIEDILLKRHKS